MSQKAKRQRKPRARKNRNPLELTAFQRAFVAQYLVDLDGAAAAKRAGSRAKDPKRVADTLLSTPAVCAAIAEGMKNRAEHADVKADDVVAELKRIAFSNISKYTTVDAKGQVEVNLSKMTFDDAAVIKEIRVEDIETGHRTGRRTIFKLHDKIAALHLLAKHLGMLTNLSKVEHNVSLAELEDVSRRFDNKVVALVAAKYDQGAPRRLQ